MKYSKFSNYVTSSRHKILDKSLTVYFSFRYNSMAYLSLSFRCLFFLVSVLLFIYNSWYSFANVFLWLLNILQWITMSFLYITAFYFTTSHIFVNQASILPSHRRIPLDSNLLLMLVIHPAGCLTPQSAAAIPTAYEQYNQAFPRVKKAACYTAGTMP
jgi:hypothetical protein